MNNFTEENFLNHKLKFSDLDANGQISGIPVVETDYYEESIFEGVHKRPYLVDKDCYIKVEFIGRIGGQLLA